MKPEQRPSTAAPSPASIKEIDHQARARMEKTKSDLRHELSSIRTGRASVSLLDHVRVDYFGSPTPLNQLATLGVPDTLITVQPWDVSQIGVIEKAIRAADLGLNPANDGKIVRVPIPPLNEERRKELVRHLHNVLENHRVAARNNRRDANEMIKKLLKDKKISEDEDKRAHDDIQKLTDHAMGEIDQIGRAKEKEILEIR